MTDPQDVLTRPAPPPDLRIAYGPLPDQVADIRLPHDDQPAQLVLVVHGGFWRARYDRGHTGPQCAALAEAGFAVAAIEYRRVGGGGGWPATFDDVAAAVDRVPRLVGNAVPGRTDPARYVLVGHSAGGQLALWAASRHRLPADVPWRRPRADHALRGVVSLAGVADLRAAAAQGVGDHAVTAMIGGAPADVPHRYRSADPVALVPTSVPSVLIHGSNDVEVPVDLSRRYAQAAGAAGDPVRLTELSGTGHYALIDPESGAWPAVVAGIRVLADPGLTG